MLFNSYEFLLLFLPITAIIFYSSNRKNHQLGVLWLTIASTFFYVWWDARYVILLASSIGINYLIGNSIIAEGNVGKRKRLLILGIAFNLAVLFYYKYTAFFLSISCLILSTKCDREDIVLPLGISFFTFTQITFLVDAYRQQVRKSKILHYVLFVTYFPHLIAGPILHHKDVISSFARKERPKINYRHFAVGITLFIFGLFKKVVIADGISGYVVPVFNAAEQGYALSIIEAWGGAIAFTMQIYFDFSGYSDMAVGLSLLFGIYLPINFWSPYKAQNISEFWRRWHITLSRLLREYLYIPLGGNRKGPMRRYVNLMFTMLLGGLWHGANWTFVVWGGLHGLYLVIYHGWCRVVKQVGDQGMKIPLADAVAWSTTFLAVIIGWVFFRASSLESAFSILKGMAGMNGVKVSASIVGNSEKFVNMIGNAGVKIGELGFFYGLSEVIVLGGLLLVVVFSPNCYELLRPYFPSKKMPYQVSPDQAHLNIGWRPTIAWVLCVSSLAIICLIKMLGGKSEFIYFQF